MGVEAKYHIATGRWESVAPMPKLLFLDDRSKRLHAAIWKYGDNYAVTLVATAKECIKMLSNEGPWDVVSLDHDLCFEEFVDPNRDDCGMEVVRWLERRADYMEKIYVANWPEVEGPQFIIHTSNKAAADEMYKRLKKSKYGVVIERFTYDD